MERNLLEAEWTILKALWNRDPQTMHEVIVSVQKAKPDTDWQYKTYHSYLRIMLEKGLIGCEEKTKRIKLYFPLISREEALYEEDEGFLSLISSGSNSF